MNRYVPLLGRVKCGGDVKVQGLTW